MVMQRAIIEESILFKKHRNVLMSDSTKQLYDITMESSPPGMYFTNASYLHLLMIGKLVLDKSSQSLSIFAGENFYRVFKDLEDSFASFFKRNPNSKANRIIIVARIKDSSEKEWKINACKKKFTRIFDCYKPYMQWKVCVAMKSLPQMCIVDDKMLWERAANAATARVYFNSPNLSQTRKEAFDRIWLRIND